MYRIKIHPAGDQAQRHTGDYHKVSPCACI